MFVIVCAGFGYAIVSPETFHLNGCITVQDNHLVIGGGTNSMGGDGAPTAIYIPLPLPGALQMGALPPGSLSPTAFNASPAHSPAEVVSISCQTEDKEALNQSMTSSPDDKMSTSSKVTKLDRTFSFRDALGKGKKDHKDCGGGELGRSASVRYSQDKAQGLVKDINLKTSDLHQDKDKGRCLLKHTVTASIV